MTEKKTQSQEQAPAPEPVYESAVGESTNDVSRSRKGLRSDLHQALLATTPGPHHTDAVETAEAALARSGSDLPADIRAHLEQAIAVHKPLSDLHKRGRKLLEEYV